MYERENAVPVVLKFDKYENVFSQKSRAAGLCESVQMQIPINAFKPINK